MSGTVELATAAETEAGVDATRAIHPAGADATYVKKSLVDAKGDIIVATADNTLTRVAVGTNGQVLKANSAQASGVQWAAKQTKLSRTLARLLVLPRWCSVGYRHDDRNGLLRFRW